MCTSSGWEREWAVVVADLVQTGRPEARAIAGFEFDLALPVQWNQIGRTQTQAGVGAEVIIVIMTCTQIDEELLGEVAQVFGIEAHIVTFSAVGLTAFQISTEYQIEAGQVRQAAKILDAFDLTLPPKGEGTQCILGAFSL